MILFLHVILFYFFIIFTKKSFFSDFWCDYLYKIHNIWKYFEFVSVPI